MSGVRKVILNESILLDCDLDNGVARLLPGAEYVLRKLMYSTISMEITYEPNLPTHKVSLLKQVAERYSCACTAFTLPESFGAVNGMNIACNEGKDKGRILFVISARKKNTVDVLSDCEFWVVFLDADRVCLDKDPNVICIHRIEELPLIIFQLNKSAGALAVAVVMKPTREVDFARRGSFPMRVTENGLIFMPITPALPVFVQLKEADIVLHKVTDEILSIDPLPPPPSSSITSQITYTPFMLELKRYLRANPHVCVVDPFESIYPLLDRLSTLEMLKSLPNPDPAASRHRIRAPRFLKVDNFCDVDIVRKLATLQMPTIVKPQVACGVAEAHRMAIVFSTEEYLCLDVPIPAIVQEYVDHSSWIFKVYVLGGKIFYACRRSMPSANSLIHLYSSNGPLIFDSLKSLPLVGDDGDSMVKPTIDMVLLTSTADFLRDKLNLTIFGFDVVVEAATGDYVIVDVNYLPSFKEVSDDIAIPAFWDALRTRCPS